MKMIAFWDTALCHLVEVDRLFRCVYFYDILYVGILWWFKYNIYI
jgi:hypothetical protein